MRGAAEKGGVVSRRLEDRGEELDTWILEHTCRCARGPDARQSSSADADRDAADAEDNNLMCTPVSCRRGWRRLAVSALPGS